MNVNGLLAIIIASTIVFFIGKYLVITEKMKFKGRLLFSYSLFVISLIVLIIQLLDDSQKINCEFIGGLVYFFLLGTCWLIYDTRKRKPG